MSLDCAWRSQGLGVRDVGLSLRGAMSSFALVVVAPLVLLGCGSGTYKPRVVSARAVSSLIKSPLTESSGDGRRGGTLTVLSPERLSSIDPGAAHSELGYEMAYATQRPLFSCKPGSVEAVPDLASAPAVVSPDGGMVMVHIRSGVRFSPPVDREVTSADVAYAIERGANPNVANPYFQAYFSSIKGAKTARGGRISGIATPDSHTIVFHVLDQKAQTLAYALSLPLSAPVPEEFAKRYDAESPSRYGDYQVATGPYMFKSNARHGILGIGYRPGSAATLVRNPSWRASTDFRPAYLDEIHLEIGGDPSAIGHQVLEGFHLVQNGPSPAIAQVAEEHFRNQLQISPGAGSRYIAVNNKRGPFSSIYVREALWAALDRTALSRVVGAPLTAEVASHFLYPGIPGFMIAADLLKGRALTYDERPRGSMVAAEGYMKQAGYPSGMYTGAETLSVVGSTGEPSAKVAEVANATLHRLGFKTRFKLVSRSAMYAKYCGVPAREIDVCPDVGWRADFADGQAVIYQTFNGHQIKLKGNQNWGQVNEPDLNSAIEREAKVIGREGREQSWGAVDNGLVGAAAAIPYAWVSEPGIESKDVAGVGELWNAGAWDLSFTSLK